MEGPGMLVLEDSFVNVEGHVQVYKAIDVVQQGEHDADEEGACPVNSDVKVLFKGGIEVTGHEICLLI